MLRLLIIAVLIFAGYLVWDFLRGEYHKAEDRSGVPVEVVPERRAELPGLPPGLTESHSVAQARGPATLKKWLEINRKYIKDPKLGDIELDYAVAVVRQNSGEAREYYKNVKDRTPASSPLQPRLQSLARTFE